MINQRIKFIIDRGLVTPVSASASAGLPVTPGAAEDTVNRLESSGLSSDPDQCRHDAAAPMRRSAGQRLRRLRAPTPLRAAHDIRGGGVTAPKGARQVRDPGKLALLMAGLAVVAVVASPAADARPYCDQTDGTTAACRTNGNASIEAEGDAYAETMVPSDWRNMIPWQTGGRRTYGGRQ